jgi:hypothetical protein
MYKFNYSVQNSDYTFADDLPSRSMAREELKEVKALGYKDAKIIRTEYIQVSQRQVR